MGAKGCGVLLQIVAIPYSVRVLGFETYGTYATAAALFGWISLLEIGVGANVIRGIVSAINRQDSQKIGRLFKAGLAITSLLAMGSAGTVFAGMWLFDKVNPAAMSKDALPLFAVAASLAGLQITMGAAARARAAFQETHINNLFGAGANLASALLLWIVVKPGTSSCVLLLVLNGPLVAAQFINGIDLLARKPVLLSAKALDWSETRELLRGGTWLALAQAGVFLEREAPKLLLAATSTAFAVGRYACAVQILLMMAGLVIMVSAPMLPAIADAMESGDHHWWRRRVILLLIAILSVGVLAATTMAFYGPRLTALVFGRDVEFTASECAGLMVWGTTVLLSHVLYVALVAAGCMKRVAQWQLAQGIIIVLSFFFLYRLIGLSGMFWLSAAITSIVTFVPWWREAQNLARGVGRSNLSDDLK